MTQRAWPAWARASEILDLLRLSGPIAISRLSWMLMGLTDAIVLGQVKGQEHELAFILNSWLPIGVTLGFGMGILLGVQVLTSELVGRGEEHLSGRIFRRGMGWAVLIGLGVTALVYFIAAPLFQLLFVEINPNENISASMTPEQFADETALITQILSLSLLGFMISTVCSYYLESLRRPLIVTITSYLGVGVNLVIDLALVLGWWGMPQMGGEGVAWATVGSRWAITFALIGFVIWLTPARTPSEPGPEDEAKRQITVGGGTAISNVAEWGGFNLTYTIAAFVSVAVNAVYGYSVQIMGFCFMFFLGIGTATSVRVAEHVGRGNMQGVKDASRLGVAATFVLGTFLALMIYAFKDGVALLLVNSEASIDGTLLAPAIAAMLIYAALATTFDGLQATASMALRAQGVVWLPSAIHIASFFALMIPLCYVMSVTMGRGVQGMMEAVTITLLVAGGLQWGLLEWKTARREVRHAV
ncbi:MAG: polysaccharide biosynthesis C-terminal domain-containing protein [Henriciella sp.]|nr:polysaccharide biosynthesis C-terminal domain-containing protein [Henriciella sp.]MBO6695023.1 polysaccharide biosynthesis C-terminal domain-containing protein [Henriciella sp.]